MPRMTEDGMSTAVGQPTKQRTIRCPHCSIELNLPESALGRRLKCPKCEQKFTATEATSGAAIPAARSGSSSLYLPVREGGSSGSQDLPSFGGNSSGDFELPTSLAPLRETFDLPLLANDLPPSRAQAPAGGAADAMGLFQDEAKPKRKSRGAEGRAQARRCSSCSSIVPAGMSLCSRCGLDLDTGQRVAPLEIYEDEAPAVRRQETPPIGVLLVGSLCLLGFLLLAMVSLVQWGRGVQGAPFLLVIWLFGLFAGVQFLRRKSIRPIFVALSLAIGVGSVYLIALPIYYANMPPEAAPTDDGLINPVATTGDDFDGPQIRSIAESLDMNRITWGVGSLLSYAAVAVYLNSPGLRRQFGKH